MLPKHLRLPAAEIPTVAQKGRLFTHQFLHIRVWYDESLTAPECAITISTKVDKNATTRNRIKRKLRVGILDLVQQGKLKPAKYLLIAKTTELASADPALVILDTLNNPAFKRTGQKHG
ncbi:ribonuclease P protein component [Candidatus Dojkabacteria bacterium]|uniref:Ribonuclease P protein component n=1 Tax=Candidatus Dojkabacteria bacterium TaxID=2099670 RepID=A0A955I6C9_9BACT|nr:ribonuclease P protein component [Candidatus Dojkabacteria bacterium]